MIKSTGNTNYNIKPINSNYEIPTDYKLSYIDKLVGDSVIDKLHRLENSINNSEQVFYSYMTNLEKKLDKNKLDNLHRYLDIIKRLPTGNVSILDSNYIESFEKIVIKPILKDKYVEFKIEADMFKYPKYISKNIILVNTVVNRYRDIYRMVIESMYHDLNKLDVLMFTNYESIKELFPNKAIYYKDIPSVINKDILFLDLPFNIETVISKIDKVTSKEVNLYYISVSNSKHTLLDRDVDIIDIYNKLISHKLKIDYSFKSEVFNNLIDNHVKPNKFLKESSSLEVLKTWSSSD